MTSKKALNKIIEYIKYKNKDEHIPFFLQLYIDDINKDLDGLEMLISVLHKFKDEEYFDLDDETLGMDGRIDITQHETDVLKRVLKFKE